MELAETETKTEIKSATAVEHFPRAAQREWYYLNSSNRLPNNEPWNIQHGNGKTTHETQLTTGKRETAKQLRNMADNSPNRTQTQNQTQPTTEVAHTHQVEKWQNANRKNGRKSNEKCIMKIRNVRGKEKRKTISAQKYYLQ